MRTSSRGKEFLVTILTRGEEAGKKARKRASC